MVLMVYSIFFKDLIKNDVMFSDKIKKVIDINFIYDEDLRKDFLIL